MSFSVELARNLRDARLMGNMTQKDLAQQIGAAQTTLSQYENARRMPSVKMVSLISSVLDVSLDVLIPKVLPIKQDNENQTNIYDLIGDE